MQEYQHYFDENKKLWNQRTIIHKDSSFYDVASFLQGKSSLNKIELEELGAVNGKKILHLQCHFGIDSLSLARMGADVTGVDLSDTAIDEAIRLNDQLSLNAKFVCCNVYNLKDYLNESFDIVFTSYGAIGWLPDLNKWAEIVSSYTKPGGFFYMVEFHPVVWMFDEEFTHVKYYYGNHEVIITENEGTYTDRNAEIDGKEYSWNHSISEVVNALINVGLKIRFFHEYMYSPYPCFRNTVETEKGKWHIKGVQGKIPIVYSLKAGK